MVILLLFAFFSGLTTIFAPCIWPVLPLVLSFSMGGKSHLRPLGVTMGILVSFSLFTLAISTIVTLLHLDPNILRLIAVGFLIFFGISMLIPSLTYLIEGLASRLTQLFGGTVPKRGDFVGGFLSGISLGILWSPCAGPIFATIAAVAIVGQVTINVVLVTLAYIIGVGIPLFLFAYGGQKVFIKTRFLSPHTGKIQKIFGIFTILIAIAIFTNYDKVIQVKLLDLIPQYGQLSNSLESNPQVTKQLQVLKGTSPVSQNTSSYGQAPEFIGISRWLNVSSPISIKDLKGKVVLVDFWTYTCINCIRTLPHVTAWYEKYKNKGLVVVGVHTPEFEFEKNTNNVEQAIQQYHIAYPVAQDNDYKTWDNYSNQYWPAEYLIDSKGVIQEEHFGEGNYEETEKKIQELLKKAGQKVDSTTIQMPDQTPKTQISPETYLGTDRMQYFYPQGTYPPGNYVFSLQKTIPLDTFSFGGGWTLSSQYATSGKDATLLLHFNAQKVFLVLRPPQGKVGKISLLLDGQVIDTVSDSDVVNGVITVDKDRLYTLINQKVGTGEHILQLNFQTPGTQCFAFTFG